MTVSCNECSFLLVTSAAQMTELKQNVVPIMNLINGNALPPSPGVEFIKAKHQTIIKYYFRFCASSL